MPWIAWGVPGPPGPPLGYGPVNKSNVIVVGLTCICPIPELCLLTSNRHYHFYVLF